MIGRAVQALGLHRRDANFDYLADDLLLALLANPSLAPEFGVELQVADQHERDSAEELGELLQRRSLYKIAYPRRGRRVRALSPL